MVLNVLSDRNRTRLIRDGEKGGGGGGMEVGEREIIYLAIATLSPPE